MASRHTDKAHINSLPASGSCKGCKQRDTVINQLSREVETLADLAVKLRNKLSKLARGKA